MSISIALQVDFLRSWYSSPYCNVLNNAWESEDEKLFYATAGFAQCTTVEPPATVSLLCSGRAAAIYRDMRYILYIFSHITIQTYMGYTEIDGRIDGERRKYTKSHSAAATSVGPHTYIRIPLRCCVHVHIYCKLSAPIEIKISARVSI